MSIIKKVFNVVLKDGIGKPPWDYYFLQNLDEKEYPRYLAKLFYMNTGEKLPLCFDFHKKAWIIDKKRCKTFNQKIQWMKLNEENLEYYNLVRKCTDKVAVRDYVAEKIGEEYLKPVLQIIGNCSPSTSGRGRGEGITLAEIDVSTYFDQINWEKLPQAFVIKCNHGCKWQYIIKNKDMFLQNKRLIEIVKRNITGWLEQDYSFFGGFEMQYRTSITAERKGYKEKGIEPKILIEPLMREEINMPIREIEVYCFNGEPKIFVNVRYGEKRVISYYNEKFNQISLILHPDENNIIKKEKADDYINQTFDLSIKLSKDFNFVRVDWIVFNNKLYFNEITFTPYSGLIKFDKKWNLKLGSLINLEGGNYELSYYRKSCRK